MKNKSTNLNSRRIFLAILLLAGCSAYAQQPAKLCKWWVEFKDKSNSPYSIHEPEAFLSARSIERRERNGCPVREEDLPVNPQYLTALRQKGFVLHGTSRWMNAAAIIADTATALKVMELPFVKQLTYLGRDIRIKNPPNRREKKRSVYPINTEPQARFGQQGYAAVNEGPLQTPFLHEIGARGAGIWVAVMDGGFINVDTMPFFDSIAVQGRLWPGPDFVEHDRAVYESAQHGTAVLSVMAANMPGYFVGAAPEATYFLLKTEDTGGEFPVEEVNWIFGAEWADSIGVDIINASLGYTTFTDTLLNHRFSELDGRTAIGSRGATIAAQKGMIICNSAGNSGDEKWHYLGVPADAPGVIAVGAFDSQTGKHAPFSSYGPTADGRIKPDLSAPGQNVITAGNVGDELTISAGTSIASPILVGSIAALWSDFPQFTAATITDAVFRSADQYEQPDVAQGYGIPDFSRAWMDLQAVETSANNGIYGFNYETGTLTYLLPATLMSNNKTFIIKNIFNQICATGTVNMRGNDLKVLKIEGLGEIPSGFYRLYLSENPLYFGK